MPRPQDASVLLLLLALLIPSLAAGQEPTDEPVPPGEEPAPAPEEPPAEDSPPPAAAAEPEGQAAPSPAEPPATAPDTAPSAPEDSAVLLAVPGRTFAGLLVEDGEYVVTLLELARVGFPVRVGLADGSQTRARLVAKEPGMGLALLRLDAPARPEFARVPSARPVERGEALRIVGHGGTSLVPPWLPELGAMVSFSTLNATVAAAGPDVEDDGLFPGFLVDRTPGEGDLGAPIFDADDQVVGLLADAVDEGAGRALAVSGAAIALLLAQERRETPYPRQSHFQSWGGVGLVVHNQPLHFAGAVLLGARVSVIDQIRIEPWFELDLGTRVAVSEPEASPQTFWWSLETGLNLGYRLNIFNPRSRDYLVPNVGFRIGWNRFDHNRESLVADCDGGDCRWTQTSELVRQESLRPGLDLGLDVRKGNIRIGYRFFIAPANVDLWSMHRLFVTFDGFPLPIRFGDSN